MTRLHPVELPIQLPNELNVCSYCTPDALKESDSKLLEGSKLEPEPMESLESKEEGLGVVVSCLNTCNCRVMPASFVGCSTRSAMVCFASVTKGDGASKSAPATSRSAVPERSPTSAHTGVFALALGSAMGKYECWGNSCKLRLATKIP